MNSFKLLKVFLINDLSAMFLSLTKSFKGKSSTSTKVKSTLSILGISTLILVILGSWGFLITQYGLNLRYIAQIPAIKSSLISGFFVFSIIFELMLGFSALYNLLYTSKDFKKFSFLPIKMNVIFNTKLIESLLLDLIFTLAILYLSIITFYPDIVSVLISLILIVSGLLVAKSILIILSYIIRRIFKTSKYVQTVLSVILMISIMAIALANNFNQNQYSQEAMKRSSENIGKLVAKIDFLNIISTNALATFSLLALSILFLFIAKAIVVKDYHRCLFIYETFEKRKKIKDSSSYGSIFSALFKREVSLMTSHSVYISEIGVGTILPLIILFSTLIGINRSGAFDVILVNPLAIGIFFTIASAVLVFSTMNGYFVNALSREGNGIKILKSLPIKNISYIRAKMLLGFIMSLAVPFISLIVLAIYMKTFTVSYLLIIIKTLLMLSISGLLLFLLDILKPRYNIVDPVVLQKRSIRPIIAMPLNLVVIIVTNLPLLLLFKGVDFELTNILSCIMAVIIFSIIYIIVEKKSKRVLSATF